MIRSDKKLAALQKTLEKGRHEEILGAITQLRDEEPFSGALRLLANHYEVTDDEAVKLSIAAFFNDMKQPSARDEVMNAITASSEQATRAMLVSSCWQSGLDYSGYALRITGIFLEGDYMTSLECLTLADTFSMTLAGEERATITGLLESAIASFEPLKQQLTREFISMLRM